MRSRLVNSAFAATLAALLCTGVASAAPRVLDLHALGPGSGSGIVFVDVLQQASPWLGVGGTTPALDAEGNLQALRPGESAERVVFAGERYPAGDYTLEWTGRATFAVSGGTLLAGDGPNSLIVRVAPNAGTELRLRVTATDPEHPVRGLHLYLPGLRTAAPQPFSDEFVRSVLGADVVRFAHWARVDSFASPAVWPLRPRLERPTQAAESGAAFEYEILLANLTGAHPWITIPAGATDGYIRGEARVVLRTLDPSLRPVLDYGGDAMLVPNTPANRWAVMAGRNFNLAPPADAQAAARAWYARRTAEVLAIFRQTFGAQAGRIVPADSPEFSTLHRTVGNPNATLAPADDYAPPENEHAPAHIPSFRPGVPGAGRVRGPLELGGRPGVAIGLGTPLADADPRSDGAAPGIARAGSSFVVTAPADTLERRLRIYAATDRSTATLSATLEGKRYAGASLGNAYDARTGVWTVIYRAHAGGQRLVVRITPGGGARSFALRGAAVALHDLRGTRNAAPGDQAMYHNDLLRTGWNPNETALTTANVNASQFGAIGTLNVDGSVLAQPLYLAGVTLGGGTHNVLLVATEHASVYEFDADTGAQLNTVSLGTAASSKSIGCSDIKPEYGVTATPVVDRSTNTVYVVTVNEPQKNQFHVTLHALDLLTLADKVAPVDLNPSVTLSNGEKVAFDPQNQHVRPGLVWSNKSLYLGIGSHCDNDAGDIVGWVLDYDAKLGLLAAFPTIEDHAGYLLSSVWQSGFAPAVSATGDVYFATGNGAFDASSGGRNFGESVVRINAALGHVQSYFTPHEWQTLNRNDEDLGSGGVMLLPQQPGSYPNLAVAQGKSSKIYLLDAVTLGGETKTDSGALAVTKPTGAGVWGGPAYYSGPTGQFVYYQAGGDVLRAYALGTNAQGVPTLTRASTGSSQAGYGGSTPVVSSNGQIAGTGIVWEVERGNKKLYLEAYDATNLTSLLFSAPAGTWPASNGFETLLVANGKVYVPGENGIAVFGLK